MQLIKLTPRRLAVIHRVLSWAPAPVLKPNLELLKRLRRGPVSRTGKRQSEISRKRQAFITGGRNGFSRDEIEARRQYDDEWGDRLGETDV